MTADLFTLLILPVLLGLLGFVEPCTVGAHVLFLQSLPERAGRWRAILAFVLVRALAMGLIGVGFAAVGRALVGAQTALWATFGALYLLIGLGYLTGWHRAFTRRIRLAPEGWRTARNPVVLGLAFGLNIPACAAPLIFGLFAAGAGTATLWAGFVMLALFGLALSLPLVAIDLLGRRDFALLGRLKLPRPAMRRTLGAVFLLLGLWSLWFGFFVDPADWSVI